jgi:uncharacterized RDD family membrane protein YckC
MNTLFKNLRAALLVAAFAPLLHLRAADTPAPTETPLHEIGSAPSPAPSVARPTPAPAVSPSPAPALVNDPGPRLFIGDDHDNERDQNNRVSVGGTTYVGPKETVYGNAVAVLGSNTVDGTVDGNSVAVIGENVVNGTIHGNAVAVLGSLKLGPRAHVDGNAVSVGGIVERDPNAFIGGNIVQQGLPVSTTPDSELALWFKDGLRMGRPLAFHRDLHVFWLLVLCQVVLYLLLAVAFPNGIQKCGDALAHRTGATLLTGIVAVLALPILFVLLLITVIGIPVALVVLPILLIAGAIFGKASVYSLVGRSVTGKQSAAVLAMLVGVTIFVALYAIPVLGLALWVLVGFLGFASALTALLASYRSNAAASQRVAPAAAPTPVSAPVAALVVPAPGAAPGGEATPVQPSVADAVPQPPPVSPQPAAASSVASESDLPRAGFWIRMAALVMDTILIGIIVRSDHFIPVMLAIYGAVLWKLKGATVGGIIFGLKVVRLDARPVDWVTAIVRALGCFLSLFAIGLGFIWIAFDREKQGWHDKIAGTVVVRLPKGGSLV